MTIRALLLTLLLATPALAMDTEVSELNPGDHTWGEEIAKPKHFFWGKVVLVLVADGAGLDSKLLASVARSVRKSQGKPLSIVIADKDGQNINQLNRAIEPHLDRGWQNWSLTDSPEHPKLAGKTHPHYLLFDHKGTLVSQGKASTRCVSAADKLLRLAPAVYVGHEPLKYQAGMARRVEKKSGFPGVVLQLQQMMKGAEDDQLDEIERLYNAISTYRDRQVARLNHLLRYSPAEAKPHVEKLFQELLGSELEVKIERDEVAANKDLARAAAIGKTWQKLKAAFRKKIGKARDAAARKKVIDPLAKTARKLMDADPSLPVCQAIEAWLEHIGADAE